MAMLAIRGVYERHGVTSLNHGIGFGTAAIELLLPTYAESLGLRGKICRNWVLNPHPTLIPAIESGWVETRHRLRRRGRDGGLRRRTAGRLHDRPRRSARSNRMACPDSPGSTRWTCSSAPPCRWTRDANSSTVIAGPARRLRRRAQHGQRREGQAPRIPGMAGA